MSFTKTAKILESGTQLGPYHIVSLIGEGGMGSVYKAFDSVLNRHVALKVILPDQNCDDVMIMRFICEGQALARLNHQNVVTAYALGEEKGQHYIAMEYVEGNPLDVYIKQKQLSYKEIIEIFRQLLEGMKALHARGIIHRDLKPKNIIVCKDKNIKIVDFGIAQFSQQQNMDLTSAGMLIGSIPYLSPELVAGETARFQSDIWSLGVIIYELLVGKRPFVADNQLALIEKIKHQEIEYPAHTIEAAPKGLLKIVSKMCRKETYKRYNSADEILKDLSLIILEESLSGRQMPIGVPQVFPDAKENSRKTRSGPIERETHLVARGISAVLFLSVLLLTVFVVSKRYLKPEMVTMDVPPQAVQVVEALAPANSTTTTTVKAVAIVSPPTTLPPAPPPMQVETKPEVKERPRQPFIAKAVDVTPAKPFFRKPEAIVKAKKVVKKIVQRKPVGARPVVVKKVAKVVPVKKAKLTPKPAAKAVAKAVVAPTQAPQPEPVRSPAAVVKAAVPVEKPLAILPTPKTKLPPNGVSIVSMSNSQDPIVFKWETSEEASNYVLELSAKEDFSEILFKVQTKNNRAIVTSPLPKGRVFWRVRALGHQAASEWTSPAYFDLTK